jgi:hypothetical protein
LKLLEEIRGKSLDELDKLILQFQWDIRDTCGNTFESSTFNAEGHEHDNSDILSDANSGSVWEP